MPLTTLSSNIDYAFITVPLLNSLVSIKIWLFKNSLNNEILFDKIGDKQIAPISLFNASPFFKDVKTRAHFNRKYFKLKELRDIAILKKKHDIAHIAAVEQAERVAELATEQAEIDGTIENKMVTLQIPEKKSIYDACAILYY